MKTKSLFIITAMMLMSFLTISQEYGKFTDERDGKIYIILKIGTQTWMAENLAYKTTSGCWAYDNDTNNVSTYGYLYDWETAKIACPRGWHLPKNGEWATLVYYLGNKYIAGGRLKEAGTIHWISPNTGSANSIGFNALPGGSRLENGIFRNIKCNTNFWTSTPGGKKYAKIRHLIFESESVFLYSSNKANGFSARCLKD